MKSKIEIKNNDFDKFVKKNQVTISGNTKSNLGVAVRNRPEEIIEESLKSVENYIVSWNSLETFQSECWKKF